MRLALLAPDTVEAILERRQAEALTLKNLMAPFHPDVLNEFDSIVPMVAPETSNVAPKSSEGKVRDREREIYRVCLQNRPTKGVWLDRCDVND